MSRHIPDWRYLLICPSVGLQILEELEAAARTCAKTTLKDAFYRDNFFGTPEQQPSEDDLLMGLNFPPSVSQLHVQCILAPMLPFHYFSFIKNEHFTIERFFPLEYIKRILALGEHMDVKTNTDIKHIINHFNARVNYNDMHAAFIHRVHDRQHIRGVWDSRIFNAQVTRDNATLFEQDKQKLTNHGTNGTAYYKYAKNTTVPSWLTPEGVATDTRAQLSAQDEIHVAHAVLISAVIVMTLRFLIFMF